MTDHHHSAQGRERSVVGAISRNTLMSELGANIAEVALRRLPAQAEPILPDLEILKPGDVILCRPLDGLSKAGAGAIELAQSRRASPASSYWTHAMVYVGHLFVAESTWLPFDSSLSGLRIVPLTEYMGYAHMICRHHEADRGYGNQAALYALVTCYADKRRYPAVRAARSVVGPAPKEFARGVTCSEFALECFAIGAAVMVGTYMGVQEGDREFYPSDLHDASDFLHIPMTYRRLVG